MMKESVVADGGGVEPSISEAFQPEEPESKEKDLESSRPTPEDTETSTGDASSAKENTQAGASKASESKKATFLLGGLLFFALLATGMTVAFVMARNSPDGSKSNTAGPAQSAPSSASSSGAKSSNTGSDIEQHEGVQIATDDEPIGFRSHLGMVYDAIELAKPFDVEPQPFSKEVLQGYSSVDAFEEGATEFLKFAMNNVILYNIANHDTQHTGFEWDDDTIEWDDDNPLADIEEGSTTLMKGPTSTNNQEHDADEADFVKADDGFLYCVYDDELIILNYQGETLSSRRFPVGYHNIHDLLVTENHVMVVSDGRSDFSTSYSSYGYKVLEDRNATQLFLYSKPTGPNFDMDLLATKRLNGHYVDSIWLQDTNTIHVVTKGSVNTYGLVSHLNVDNFPWTTQSEYIAAAAAIAERRLIPKFVRTLKKELNQEGQGFPRVLKFSSWTSTGTPPSSPSYSNPFAGMLNGYIQVTSMGVDAFPTKITTTEAPQLNVSVTAMMSPEPQSTTLYGTGSSLVLAVGLQTYDAATSTYDTNTNLLKMDVIMAGNVINATFHSLATLEGRLATERYSIDIKDNDLRVATTAHRERKPFDHIIEVCGREGGFDDPCIPDYKWFECEAAVLMCDNITRTGCPATYTCSDGSAVPQFSRTVNSVVVLDIEKPGDMVERGRIQIGQPDEVVYSVRFSEDFSYAVTFATRSGDPFYVLNLEAGQAPTLSGQLKPNGFFRYLHPINDDHTMILGIGQNTTSTSSGFSETGLLIAVFDATDPQNPKIIASQMVVDHDYVDSESRAEFDPKAVRFFDGTLIVPVRTDEDYYFGRYDDEFESGDFEFEGFVVYDVSKPDEEGIKELFRVSHEECSSYYGSSYRSFLYDDNKKLMTIGHGGIISSDMETGAQNWNSTLDGSSC